MCTLCSLFILGDSVRKNERWCDNIWITRVNSYTKIPSTYLGMFQKVVKDSRVNSTSNLHETWSVGSELKGIPLTNSVKLEGFHGISYIIPCFQDVFYIHILFVHFLHVCFYVQGFWCGMHGGSLLNELQLSFPRFLVNWLVLRQNELSSLRRKKI